MASIILQTTSVMGPTYSGSPDSTTVSCPSSSGSSLSPAVAEGTLMREAESLFSGPRRAEFDCQEHFAEREEEVDADDWAAFQDPPVPKKKVAVLEPNEDLWLYGITNPEEAKIPRVPAEQREKPAVLKSILKPWSYTIAVELPLPPLESSDDEISDGEFDRILEADIERDKLNASTHV